MAKHYPAAARGIKQIFTSEIMMIFGSLCIGVSLACAGFNGVDASSINEQSAMQYAIPFLVFGGAGAFLCLFAAILQLVGIHRAGKDSKRFKNAFTFIILAIIVGLAASLMNACWPDVFGSKFQILSEGAINVLELVSVYFVMTGIRDLAIGAGKPKLATTAGRIWNTYCTVIIASALISLLSLANVNEVVLGIIALATVITGVVADIAYLVLLAHAKNAIR